MALSHLPLTRRLGASSVISVAPEVPWKGEGGRNVKGREGDAEINAANKRTPTHWEQPPSHARTKRMEGGDAPFLRLWNVDDGLNVSELCPRDELACTRS